MQLLGALLLAVALTAGLEGANLVSGGEMYLASVRLLAQDTSMMHSAPPPPPPSSPIPSSTMTAPTMSTPIQAAPPPPPMPSPTPMTTPTEGSGSGQTMPPPPPMPPTTSTIAPHEGSQMMPPPPGARPGMMPGEAGPQGTQMGAPYQGSRQMMPPPPGARPGMMPGGTQYGGSSEGNQAPYPPMPPQQGRGGFKESLPRGGDSGLEHEIEKSKMMPPPPTPAGGPPREDSNKNNRQDNGQKKGSEKQPMVNPFQQFDRQENHEGGEFDGGFEEHEEDRLDPREVAQVLSEIKRMRGDVKRLQSQAKKSGINGALSSELAEIAQDLERLAAVLTGSADNFDKREAINEFRDGQYHDKLNEIRAKVEVPQEIKKLTQAIKRLKKMIGTKAIKNLGVDLGRVNADISEMEQALQAAQTDLNNGDYEDARAALQEFYDGGHPNEIESALFRIKDAKNYQKRIRDAALRSKLEQIIQEAIQLFNGGEYREAREYLEGQMKGLR